ncbi:MAG: GNAT family N-acetyltransferase [Actinomycetota bacterium]
MTDVTVRVAGAADVDALIALRQAWTDERRGPRPDPDLAARFRAWFEAESRTRTFWLAEIDGVAVGMVNLATFTRMPAPGIDAGAWGYLGNMFVAAEHRDGGVGRRLLDALVAHADSAGLERIVLSPSERSVRFYRRAGFDPAHQLLLRPRPKV